MNSEFYKTTLPTCKICFEEYDHFIHKPYIILPCAHSACIKCLETLMKTTKICPIDRGQIQNKKPNWELIDILDNAVPEPISSLKNENVLHIKCKLVIFFIQSHTYLKSININLSLKKKC
jgi:hypothetical protein